MWTWVWVSSSLRPDRLARDCWSRGQRGSDGRDLARQTMRSVSVPQEWVAQARAGDRQAFTLLVEAYQVPVYNLCRRMLGNPGEAEDAAQEPFCLAFQARERYDPQRPFPTWLLSIAAHYCIDYLRRQRLVALSLEAMPDYHDVPDPAPGPESSAEAHERERRVASMLQSLDPLRPAWPHTIFRRQRRPSSNRICASAPPAALWPPVGPKPNAGWRQRRCLRQRRDSPSAGKQPSSRARSRSAAGRPGWGLACRWPAPWRSPCFWA